MADRPTGNNDKSEGWDRERPRLEADPTTPTSMPAESQEAVVRNQSDRENSDRDDVVANLPPVDSLTAESDFTPFLDRAVPAELRRLALRKLWLSDPVFANLDGLNDYDDDFRTLGVGKLVRTAYQVGKGMVTRDEQEQEAATTPSPSDDSIRSDDVEGSDAVTAGASSNNDDIEPSEET